MTGEKDGHADHNIIFGTTKIPDFILLAGMELEEALFCVKMCYLVTFGNQNQCQVAFQ